MSQPRRRRRRGRRGGRGSQPQGQSNKEAVRETPSGAPVGEKGQSRSKSSRRRRGRGRSGGGRQGSGSPKSSEDLVRALPKERPETLTAPPDGQTLEGVIGDLQSTWGVPQYPQEYRIVLKVAEEKEARSDGNGQSQSRPPNERPAREQASDQSTEQGPRREKAPAAPGLTQGAQREKPPRKRRRRRKRGGQGGSNGSGGGGANGPSTGAGGSEGSG